MQIGEVVFTTGLAPGTLRELMTQAIELDRSYQVADVTADLTGQPRKRQLRNAA